LITAALHVVAVILALTIPWQAPRRPQYVVLEPINPLDTIAFTPYRDARTYRARGPTVGTAQREPPPPPVTPSAPTPPAPLTPSDTGSTMPAYDPNASALAPHVGDGRLWVSPRPALPATVADALYGDTAGRNEQAVGRLRAMVDSLNQIYDQVQRERQRPTWTVGGGEGGIPKFGIDSQYIHVAGIKIPTMALALLGNFLPQGNFDEEMRGRQLQAMREDILRAADRAQTFQDFRRYVRELRERKQAERDAERRRQAQDTTTVIP
jgi:hypothetical protein